MKLTRPAGNRAPFPPFLLMDGRYWFDTEAAIVCTTASTLEEAKEEAPNFGDDTAILAHQGDGYYEALPYENWGAKENL